MSVIMNVLNTARREGTGRRRVVPQHTPGMEKETIPIGQGFADKLNALQESNVSAIEYPEHPIPEKSIPSILNQQVKGSGFFSKIVQSASREMIFGLFVFAILCASVIFFGNKMAASPTVLSAVSSPKNIERSYITDKPIRGTFSRSLQGIVLGEGQDPYCILDGDLLKIGDVWRGSRITAINNEGVSLAQLNGTSILLSNRILK